MGRKKRCGRCVRVIGVALLVVAGGFVWRTRVNMGKEPDAADKDRFKKSVNYTGERFRNRHVYDKGNTPERDRITEADPKTGAVPKPSFFGALKMLRQKDTSLPNVFPIEWRTGADFPETPEKFAITWLGHAMFLVDLDGARFLIDPVFGHATPFPFLMSNRLNPPPMKRRELPPVDGIVISHDHYDHLEAATARFYAKRGTRFIVPLGVGARLRGWGVKPENITELDWLESTQIGGVTLTALPSHHHSMRSFTDRFSTLWCAWALRSPEHRIFYAGDGGYDPDFRMIGENYGPFDFALIGVGAYNARWAENHLFPEAAVQVAQELRAARMLPMHWGTYRLAPHVWDEPILRVTAVADKVGVPVFAPKIGGTVRLGDAPPERWWLGLK